ncbi:MAG: T9SS type A sorting domain-containing protein [Ignavibacteria bacterium]|nr:T9SS type A sorting domain-containing protein [Ignavibacteria bacterium]
MDIGDIDGDNDLDLISSNYGSGTYSIFTNNGSGIFSNTPINLPASSAGSCITILDVDNDGDMDLAGIDEVDDLLFIFKNQLVSIEQLSGIIPDKFKLEQNYPNPFNPVTHLEFGILNLGFVSLKVFDILGKEVAVLVNEKLSPGIYEAEFDGSSLSSGIYFYKLEAGDFIETKRMILLK